MAATSASFLGKSVFGGNQTGSPSPAGSIFGSGAVKPDSSSSDKPAAAAVFGSGFGVSPSPGSLFGGVGSSKAVPVRAEEVKPREADDGNNEVIFVNETEASEEMKRRAENWSLPSGFYLYETRKPCKGCHGKQLFMEFSF